MTGYPGPGSGNGKLQFTRNSKFECPSDPNSNESWANINYFGSQGGAVPGAETCVPCCTGRTFYYNGIFYPSSHIRLRDVTDGSSNVFMIGETRYSPLAGNYAGSWAASPDRNIPFSLVAADQPINGSTSNPATNSNMWTIMSRYMGSNHEGGCHVAMADGSVHFISENIDLALFRNLGARNDGTPVGEW